MKTLRFILDKLAQLPGDRQRLTIDIDKKKLEYTVTYFYDGGFRGDTGCIPLSLLTEAKEHSEEHFETVHILAAIISLGSPPSLTMDADELQKVIKFVQDSFSTGFKVTPGMVQRAFKIGYTQVNAYLQELERVGIITGYDGTAKALKPAKKS